MQAESGGAGGGGASATGGQIATGGATAGTGGDLGGVGGTGTVAGSGGGGGTVVPPQGAVPMFVAVGWGGRRIMSCDLGRTWIADQMVAPESQDDWHKPYTPKSLTYGKGKFVFLTGWGNNSTTWVSTDGLAWTSTPQPTTFGGVGLDGDTFVLVGNRYLASSPDAVTFTKLNVPTPAPDRDAAAFTGIWAAGADGVAYVRRTGGSWVAVGNCRGARHGSIGISGGFVAGLGILVSVGDDGDTCGVNIGTGANLAAGKIAGAVYGKPSFVGDAFMVSTRDKVFSSTDGVAWTSRALPNGVRFDLIARSAMGTYVGVAGDGDNFFYSDDGISWRKAVGPTGNGLLHLVSGYGTPSAQCKLP